MYSGGILTLSDILQLSNEQISLYSTIYNTLKDTMLDFYTKHSDKSFSLLMSGGYDSRFVLYLCRDLNIKVHCYTFCIDGYISTDLRTAEQVCKNENVELTVVPIPTNATELIHTMEILASDYHCVKKTDFECVMPLYYLYKSISEDIILMGTDSDNYFALGKKYALHFKNLDDGLTKYKAHLWSDPNDGQIQQKALLDANYNKQMFDVFNTKEVFSAFENTTWNELNIPYKKGPLYIPYRSKYDEIKPYRSSYQCGDSGIRELCRSALINSEYNTNNYISVVGCYNEIVRRCRSNEATLF